MQESLYSQIQGASAIIFFRSAMIVLLKKYSSSTRRIFNS